MSTFRFKRFSVINEKSSMKVNTDGVLLGACASLPIDCRSVLDIGTGTGTIALMLAQRLSEEKQDFSVKGIEIDLPSFVEASANFEASPWKNNLSCIHSSLSRFMEENADARFDLIVSNPPYFDDTLISPELRRNAARHSGVLAEDGLSLGPNDVLRYALSALTDKGIVSMVLPYELLNSVTREGISLGLHLRRIIKIRTTETKVPKRIIIEFSKEKQGTTKEEFLTLMREGKRTEQYISLTNSFYL